MLPYVTRRSQRQLSKARLRFRTVVKVRHFDVGRGAWTEVSLSASLAASGLFGSSEIGHIDI